MSETVPLESVSRWSGLSPWVALLPWRMPVRHPGIKSGAASVRGRVRGKPQESSPGQAPSCIGHRSHPQPESRRRPVRRVWGWGKRDGSPQGSGRRRQRPPCGALPGGTERPFKQSQEGGDPGSRQGTEAPRALRVVNRCWRYDSARPLSGQGRGQAFAKGLRPRKLRPETTLPGGQRIPRTAATSSVPSSPVGTSAAACPAPWL